MKKSIEIPDSLYPQIEAASAAAGMSIEAFVLASLRKEAAREMSAEESAGDSEFLTWWNSFQAADPAAVAELQAVVDEEFSQINPKDWE